MSTLDFLSLLTRVRVVAALFLGASVPWSSALRCQRVLADVASPVAPAFRAL